jgi:hypothetical protein
MVGEVSLNATSNALSAIATLPNWGTPILAVFLFIIIGTTAFLVFKNFRRLIYGLTVAVPVGILGWISWSIAKPVGEGNWLPAMITMSIIIGLGTLIMIGMIVEKTKFGKKLEGAIR